MPGLDIDAAQAAALLLAATVAGVLRGFSGFGAALVLAPVVSIIVGTHVAVPAILLAIFATTVQLFAPAWPHVRWSDQFALSVPGCIGVPAGVLLLLYLDPELMRRAISAITALIALFLLSGWRSRRPPTRLGAASMGALGGVLSGAASIGGPPVIAYLLAGPGSHTQTRATLIYYFAFTQAASLIMFWIGGLMNWEVLVTAALIAPALVAGTWAGAKLFHLASERTFRLAALTILLLVGVSTFFA